jgi:hypothetical protein
MIWKVLEGSLTSMLIGMVWLNKLRSLQSNQAYSTGVGPSMCCYVGLRSWFYWYTSLYPKHICRCKFSDNDKDSHSQWPNKFLPVFSKESYSSYRMSPSRKIRRSCPRSFYIPCLTPCSCLVWSLCAYVFAYTPQYCLVFSIYSLALSKLFLNPSTGSLYGSAGFHSLVFWLECFLLCCVIHSGHPTTSNWRKSTGSFAEKIRGFFQNGDCHQVWPSVVNRSSGSWLDFWSDSYSRSAFSDNGPFCFCLDNIFQRSLDGSNNRKQYVWSRVCVDSFEWNELVMT